MTPKQKAMRQARRIATSKNKKRSVRTWAKLVKQMIMAG